MKLHSIPKRELFIRAPFSYALIKRREDCKGWDLED